MTSPTVALLSDFGLEDNYVGIMKCVIADVCPEAQILDLCHDVPPQNLISGAYLLASAAPFLPEGTVLTGVVDPGVGSNRRAVAIDVGDFVCVGPDNGLFDMVLKHFETQQIVDLSESDYHLPEVSTTFHGRDIFAPVAGHLAAGVALEDLGESLDVEDLVRLAPTSAFFRKHRIECHVIHVDRFGNLITNLSREEAEEWLDGAVPKVSVSDREVPMVETFSGVSKGRALAYYGSSGQLEVAVRDGNAADRFGVGQDETILVERG
ncbi:MAG: SAM hydrolase/SAM-dependent halogenase family protein [Persicimonas sp.]